ncbi:MAG: hypothetical protein H6923_08845 [Alphaproteobacteria bacterium]|nr:hypothetical protein [Alphaproteobacteria bacterium]
MDGLSAVPPYGDPGLLALREPLTYPKPDSGQAHAMHKLDGLFGLNPELRSLHALYGRGEMLAVHAMASPYRERSHFDAQDVMENGASDKGMRVGWLNRALSVMPRELAKGRSDVALGIGATLPLSLRGPGGRRRMVAAHASRRRPGHALRASAISTRTIRCSRRRSPRPSRRARWPRAWTIWAWARTSRAPAARSSSPR